MEMDSKLIAGVSAAIALGILTYGIYRMTSSTSSTNKSKKSKSSKSSSTSKPKTKSDNTNDDSDHDTSLRGYKKTSTGVTTTYFHRELSAEEKILLGDSTPKRINSPGVTNGTSSPNPTGGSVWNSAGTYEEKNISEWSHSKLKSKLSQLTHPITNGQIIVTNVTKVEGESTVSMIRGKKKYLYDLTVTLNWKLQSNSQSSHNPIDITGVIMITDITADNDHEFQISDIYSSSPRSEYNSLVEKFIKSNSSSSFQSALTKAIQSFYSDMKEAY